MIAYFYKKINSQIKNKVEFLDLADLGALVAVEVVVVVKIMAEALVVLMA